MHVRTQKEKHRNLSEFVSDFVFDEFYKYKFSAMKDQLYSNYSGEYNMTKIDEEVQLDFGSGKRKTTTHKF